MCPAGFYCENCSSATECPPGTYSLYGSTLQTDCKSCSAGYSCPSQSAIPQLCEQGWYSPGGSVPVTCRKCKAGSYCPTPDTETVIVNPSGGNFYYALEGSFYQKLVTQGWGYISSSQAPVKCAAGTYWNSATALCVICSKGKFCPKDTTLGLVANAELATPTGYYTDMTGMESPQMCPAGFYCASISASPVVCPTGTYSLGAATACTDCPAGYQCSNQGSIPVKCPIGTYSLTKGGKCITCPLGQECIYLGFSATASNSPSMCSAGFYQDGNDFGKLAICHKCPPGHSCTDITKAPVPCPSGTYKATSGAGGCTPCPAGSACPYPDATPYTCPTGYSSVAGKTSCKADDKTVGASVCLAGQFAYPNPNTCLACPDGFECPTVYAPPIPCIEGYYSKSTTAGVGAQFCTKCPAGSKCPVIYLAPIACASGYYSIAGSVNCYPIPPGMKAGSTPLSTRPTWCSFDETSAITATTCTQCPDGKQCGGQDLAAEACTTDQLNSRAGEKRCFPYRFTWPKDAASPTTVNYSDNRVAKEQQPGSYNYDGGKVTVTYDCPPAYQCLFPMMQDWRKCPAGTYSAGAADKAWACEPCPEQYHCPGRGDTKTLVSNGYFSPFGVHLPLVVRAGWAAGPTRPIEPCKAGYYSNDFAGQCLEATVGFIASFPSNHLHPCNEGMESTTAGRFTCVPCAQNKIYNPTTKVCENITPGTGSLHAMLDAEKCTFGSYSDATSIANAGIADCAKCAEGYTCDSKSTSPTQTACPSGYWCNPQDENTGGTGKYPCPAGYKSSALTGAARTTLANSCVICPAGKYCEGADHPETTCPAGYFCPQGTKFSTQFPCPAARRSNAGATSLLGDDASNTNGCFACYIGEFCPQGTGISRSCPPGASCAGLQMDKSSDLCPTGQYFFGTSCTNCPVNHYCPPGIVYPLKCPAGTKGRSASGGGKDRMYDCTPCSAGELCPRYGQSGPQSDYTQEAGSGYYVTKGTQFKTQLACPPGFYDNNSTPNSWAVSQCAKCPAGKACGLGTGTKSGASKPLDCEPGFYCPQETNQATMHTRQFPCSGGTYTTSHSLSAQSQCTDCQAGYYCPKGSYRMRDCPPGYYCLAKTENYLKTPCNAGTYRAAPRGTSQASCSNCPAGFYCITEVPYPISCPPGTFSSGSADAADSSKGSKPCTPCTQGYKCPYSGMATPLECGEGYYSQTGAQSCTLCQAGYQCTGKTTGVSIYEQSSNKCNGYNCEIFATKIYKKSDCEAGYYCPSDSLYQFPCPRGTYRDNPAATPPSSVSACLKSPAGSYADREGMTSAMIADNKCAVGYKCPEGSRSKFQIACPPGTYQSQEGQSICIACPAGKYCMGATVWPIPCPAGFYCLEGSLTTPDATQNSPQPCPKGKYGSVTGLDAASKCKSCDAGFYCSETGADSPTGMCDAGYYCTGGSLTPRPSGTGGNICPVGGYCEQGSASPKYCQGGYYNIYTGKKTIFDCVKCPPGKYCSGEGLATAGVDCDAGYYCEAGSSVKDQYPAEPGSISGVGSFETTKCPQTQYNNLWHQSACFNCPEGFYCRALGTTDDFTDCPSGYYCPSTSKDPIICPAGTYNPTPNAWSEIHCLDCPSGFYCASKGLSAPTGQCDAGYFCSRGVFVSAPSERDGLFTPPRWGPCPKGHYCEKGTAYPFKCPIGTYNDKLNSESVAACKACDAGYYGDTLGLEVSTCTGKCAAGFYCSGGTTTHSPTGTKGKRCREGTYCPEGSSAEILCAAGTYNPNQGQKECIGCPAGFFCVEGDPSNSVTHTPQVCQVGRYCIENTAITGGTPCDPGFYQPEVGHWKCLKCPPGYACTSTAMSTLTSSNYCDKGYYCLGESKTKTPVGNGGARCTKGNYCEAGSSFQSPCPPGLACPNDGMSLADAKTFLCAEGYYCLSGATKIQPKQVSSDGGNICPVGHYCPSPDPEFTDYSRGTSVPHPCPPGTYNPNEGGTQTASCLDCPKGFYCQHYASTAPVLCEEGWYCEDGKEVSSMPPNKFCPKGYYCTQGRKTACPAGKYQDQIGKDSCDTCPDGYQCPFTDTTNNLAAASKKICGNNHYCPTGANNVRTACSLGFYTNKVTASKVSECSKCPAGLICECTYPLDAAICVGKFTQCPAGSYCKEGTYSLSQAENCGAGYYCPLATPFRIPCDGGYYCDLPTMSAIDTSKTCLEGYVCVSGATVNNPTDGTTGKICPLGHFCPTGSASETPCLVGTYRDATGGKLETDCTKCDGCNERGLTKKAAYTIKCLPGNYCPDDKTIIICEKGYKCGINAVDHTICPFGEYQPNPQQSFCLECPEGFYCPQDRTSNPVVPPEKAIPCEKGQYCPKKSDKPINCGKSYYMPFQGAVSLSDCIPCLAGFTCNDSEKVAIPTSKCTAGKYCPQGGIEIICPKGSYCPLGAQTAISCPVGKVQDESAQSSSSACQDCPENKYCSARGMVSTEAQLCGNGFVCKAGAKAEKPTSGQSGELCPVGYSCSVLDLGKQMCKNGYYQPNQAQGSCIGCPAGLFCKNIGCPNTILVKPTECQMGKYCLKQTSTVTNEELDCPAGYYSAIAGASSVEDCVKCPVGQYCTGGQQKPSGDCDAGFFCPIGQSTKSFTLDYQFGMPNGGKCPAGHYCPAGTKSPTPCPEGTFNDLVGQTTVDSCKNCTGGYYCDELGLTTQIIMSRNKICDAGYYCISKAVSPHPDDIQIGGMCEPGYYCRKNSTYMEACPAGFYETRAGSSQCQECPQGYYCEGNKDTSISLQGPPGTKDPTPCKNGYCPAMSSIPLNCPDGTYGNDQLKFMVAAEDCVFCPEGKWCKDGVIQGLCFAGYFCDFGASAPDDFNKICPAGHYCPAGTTLPQRCPEGFYYPKEGAESKDECRPCEPGQYCIENDTVSRICPKGHYCAAVTIEPTPCRRGQYQPFLGKYASTHCLDCPMGFFCDADGIADYNLWKCPIGHYCDEVAQVNPPKICPPGTFQPLDGMTSRQNCTQCPEGHMCREGSDYPLPCEAGYWCPAGSSKQYACKAGTYCPAMSSNETNCPGSFYCPGSRTDIYAKCTNGTFCETNTKWPQKCPAGTFGSSRTDNINEIKGCTKCGKGQYSDLNDKTCQDCFAGFVCQEGAKKPNPNNLISDGGYTCPKGFYCPAASTTPIACPLGHYSDKEGNGYANQCEPCPANFFGIEVGATSCQPCQGSTVSDVGSTSCRCRGLNRKYLAEKGQCVCMTGYEPVDGSNAFDDGFADCSKIIYPTCKNDEVRDAFGNCRSPNDCSVECDGGKGQIQVGFGICQCNQITKVGDLSTAENRKTLTRKTFSDNNKIILYNPNTNVTTVSDLKNTLGQMNCINKDSTKCVLDNVKMLNGPNGNFGANFDLPKAIVADTSKFVQKLVSMRYKYADTLVEDDIFQELKGNKTDSTVTNTTDSAKNETNMPWEVLPVSPKKNGKRLLQGGVTPDPDAAGTVIDDSTQFIQNPVVCKTLGSAILWEGLTKEKYPVYLKDSLLNTNPDFDFGEFIALPELLKTQNYEAFVFTFTQPGIYVFADSRNKAKQMIVAIMGSDKSCPSDSAFSPQTYSALLKVGASMRDVLEPPNWGMFFGVLLAGCALIIITVLIISYIVKRDWRQKYLPKIYYQEMNYGSVERSDPEDKKAIVSINTEAESFTFRHMGREEDDDEELNMKMDSNAQKLGQRKKKKQKKSRDVQLPEVEDLKDRLQKHLVEIQKLVGRKYTGEDNLLSDESDQDLESDDDEDADELNKQIADLKKLLGTNERILKGEDDDDLTETDGAGDGLDEMDDGKVSIAVKKKQQRDEDAKHQKENQDQWQKVENEKFEEKLEANTDNLIRDINAKKNTVLQQQIANAYDRGTNLEHMLKKQGATGDEVHGLINELQDKMQNVEIMMKEDEARQNELLARMLDARRGKRKMIGEKLKEVETKLQADEIEKQKNLDEALEEIQNELKEDLVQYEAEGAMQKEALNAEFELKKREKLQDFQEKLKNARTDKNFQQVLEEYQNAQKDVEKLLKKDFDKQNFKLEADLKARRARRKNQAQLKKTEKFAEIEAQAAEKIAKDLEDRDKLKENLRAVDEDEGGYASKLSEEVNKNALLMEEMEHKRRDENDFAMQQERIMRKLQGENMKIAHIESTSIDNEIQKLADGAVFDAYSTHIDERQRLQIEIERAGEDVGERARLLAELSEVDRRVKEQLANQSKQQDKALQDKLAARKNRRNKAIEAERIQKQQLLQMRINKALDNSNDYQAKKSNMTREALDELIGQMRLDLASEEIPAAVERLIDDKHQKELEDLLLKMYEQKCVELKEEVLGMMEEKIAKQQELRKNTQDRKRGIDAIISRTHDPLELKNLEQKKKDIDMKLDKDLLEIENEYMRKEGNIKKEVQQRTQDREVNYIADLQEKQIQEKQDILMHHLPDSLMTTLNAQMCEEDRKNIQELRERLKRSNAEKMSELEAKQAELEATLAKQKAELDKLGDLERQLLEKEARRKNIDNAAARDLSNKFNSQELVNKLRSEYEKGLDTLSGTMDEERKRQFDQISNSLEERKARVEEARKLRDQEKARKEEEARLEQVKEIDRIKELRMRKTQLEKTLAEGQRLIYKQCYSKPLYSFNKKLNDLQLKNEDFAWLTEKKQDDFAKDIVTTLLHKITELEHSVTNDVRSDLFARPSGVLSDAHSNFDRRSSSNSTQMRPKFTRDILNKLKTPADARRIAKF